jgi:hypothetical protein
MTRAWTWLSARRLTVAGWAAVAVFAILAGRFWHPYYGFTAWLQIDEADAAVGIPELKARPIYFYPGYNGYDGSAYAQIAFHPLLDSPDLKRAVGNVPYRARRILGSALAWVLAGGNPSRIANLYAGLNLGVWLVLAGVLWRLLPVRDARSWVTWAGLLFSAGALHSVRLALTDLLAVTLFAGAMWAAERRGPRPGLGLLALAGLARETVLAGVVAWWQGPWDSARAWWRNVCRTLLVAAPLAAWIAYIRWKVGPEDQGFGNFSWPLNGLVEKWQMAATGFQRDPGYFWLNLATVLATAALTVQGAYLFRHRRPDDPWWRAGIVGVLLMVLLGTSVWEGHPGAATRVLLPMSLAFAVFAVRQCAPWPWLVGGNLSVLSGVIALWTVPLHPREIAAGRFDGGVYSVRLESGWYSRENKGEVDWAWTATEGDLAVEVWQPGKTTFQMQLGLRALEPRQVEIRQDEKVLWSGNIGTKVQRIEFTADIGRPLRLRSEQPPVAESPQPGARALGFAIYDPTLD